MTCSCHHHERCRLLYRHCIDLMMMVINVMVLVTVMVMVMVIVNLYQ
jgi:hypothetical protein